VPALAEVDDLERRPAGRRERATLWEHSIDRSHDLCDGDRLHRGRLRNPAELVSTAAPSLQQPGEPLRLPLDDLTGGLPRVPTVGVGRARKHEDRYAIRRGDVRQSCIHAEAQIHPGEEAPHVPQREIRGVVVYVRGYGVGQQAQEVGMHWGVARRSTEKYLAAAFADEPFDDPGEAVKRPQPLHVGRLRCEKHARSIRDNAGEKAIGPRHGVGRRPALVMAVVDGDAVGPQQVEE